MAAISQTTDWNAFSRMKSFPILLKFDPKGPIDNKSVLVQVMACCGTGDKPLPEPMLFWSTEAYMRH